MNTLFFVSALLLLFFFYLLKLGFSKNPIPIPTKEELDYLKNACAGDFIITKNNHILHLKYVSRDQEHLIVGSRDKHNDESWENLESLGLSTNVERIVYKAKNSPEFQFILDGYFSDIPDTGKKEIDVVMELESRFEPPADRPPIRSLQEIVEQSRHAENLN